MSRISVLLAAACLVITSGRAHEDHAPDAATIAWACYAEQAKLAAKAGHPLIPALPPAPPGITDLRFDEFFGPIGDRGLEYSRRLRDLNGKRVRIAGFMVRQEIKADGLFLLAPLPIVTEESEYGFCDELPPATLHVIVPSLANDVVPLSAGPIVLTGKLELGTRTEADGRNSVARLILDAPKPGSPLLPSASAVTTTVNP